MLLYQCIYYKYKRILIKIYFLLNKYLYIIILIEKLYEIF